MSIDGINSKRADVNKLQQAGIHKSNFKDDDQKMKSLFDAMDTDGDGVINEEELKNFTGIDKNNDGTIKRSEARKFLKEHKNLKELGIKKRDVIEFLNKAGIVADGIEGFSGDKENGYTVEYKNSDTKKTIDKNGNYSNYDENGNSKTYDVNQQLLSSTVIDKESNITATTTFVNGDETKIDKEIIKKNDGSETVAIQYKNNHPASKEVVRGTTVETYEYIDGKEVKTSVIENKGIPAKETRTEFRYNDDGSYTAFMTQAGTNTTAAINYNSEGKRLDETKVVDGREYKAEYDGKGNTKGVVLQKGETIEQLADKFGCSVKDLQQLNGKEKFSAGDEITVKGEIEADDEKLTSRKSVDEVKSEVKSEEDAKKAEQQRQAELAARKRAIARAKRAAEDAQLKPLGLKDRKGAGEKITGEFKGGSKKTFTKVGNAINQRTIVKDEKGKYYVISHDGKVLKEEYVQKTTLYATGKKVDCKAKDANGKLITVQYAEIPGYKDKHGRTLVVDKNGNYHLRSHDGMLLKADYIDRSNKADEIKADSAKARETALEMLDSQLAAAQKDFDAQMKADGWAGDVADGISILWGSKNRASVVRKEFAHLRSDIAECKLAAMNEGEEGFRAKFKEKFGVPFNQQALADYVLNPTPANYRKAFGSKQPIGERVAQYNQSQQQGAQWVKTGVKVGAAVGAGILTGGIGGAAVATALVSGIVEETDHMSMSGNWTDSQGQTHVEERFSFREGTNHAEIWRDAALDGGAVLAGGMAGKVAQAAIKGTTTAASVARAGIMTSADVVYGAGQEYIQTGDVTTEGVLMNAALSGVGNAIGSGAFKKSSTAPEVNPEPPVLKKATNDGTTVSGGKLNNEKFAKAQEQAKNVSSEEAPEMFHQAENHRAVNRQQGRTLENDILDAQGIKRQGKELQATSTEGQKVVDKINSNHARTSDAILSEKNAGALAPHDAATLESHLVNNLNTADDVEKFMTQLKERVGMNENGKMFKYEVQGKDHAADLMAKADAKLKQLRAKEADLATSRKDVEAFMNDKSKGITNEQHTQTMEYINKVQAEVDLNNLEIAMRGKGMTGAQKKALNKAIEAKRAEIKGETKQTTSTETQEVTTPKAETPKNDAPKTEPKTEQEVVTQKTTAKGNPIDNMDKTMRENGFVSEGQAIINGETIHSYLNRKTGEQIEIRFDKDGNIIERKSNMREFEPKQIQSKSAKTEPEVVPQKEGEGVVTIEEGAKVNTKEASASGSKGKTSGHFDDIDDKQLVADYNKVNKEWQKLRNNGDASVTMQSMRERRDAYIKEIRARGIQVEDDGFGSFVIAEKPKATTRKQGTGYSAEPATQIHKTQIISPEKAGFQKGRAVTNARCSEQIKNTFSQKTQDILETLPNQKSVILDKGDLVYAAKNINGEVVITDVMNKNELCREIGNGGKKLPDEYIANSLQVRQALNASMDGGSYTSSVQSYKQTIETAHKLAYFGSEGNSFYYMKNGKLLEMNAGHEHHYESLSNNYVEKAQDVEKIAKKFGDDYSTENVTQVKLAGISDNALPMNIGTQHRYPGASSHDQYFIQMHRTAVEAQNMLKNGINTPAQKREFMEKLAEHYQYAANVRPFEQINNSLFMNEINTMLTKAGMPTMPHGILDHAAQRLQPESFQKYFISEYNRTTGSDIPLPKKSFWYRMTG